MEKKEEEIEVDRERKKGGEDGRDSVWVDWRGEGGEKRSEGGGGKTQEGRW